MKIIGNGDIIDNLFTCISFDIILDLVVALVAIL